ncbi:MAG TPA: DUF2203 domain-containing protein [Candidatus Limnocylindrales bacterium]|nr:DUF2203 domain-containing protein [Candidatus Limnocylindrales bacterium]
MTRFYDLDEANSTLREVRTILESLRDQRAELIRLRDEVLASGVDDDEARTDAPKEANVRGRPSSPDRPRRDAPDESREGEPASADTDVRVLRLRMQGVIDRMQAGVVRIDELGVTLREIETGLIDFPALASGRQIWLCWRLGDGDGIGWWHELNEGFPGRKQLADLT